MTFPIFFIIFFVEQLFFMVNQMLSIGSFGKRDKRTPKPSLPNLFIQVASKGYWTETIKDVSVTPTQVNVISSLESFQAWISSRTDSLPGHDIAMLFTA